MIISNKFNISKLGFNAIGDVPISTLKTDYILIENLSQFLFDIKVINPKDTFHYLPYWRRIKKLIVEGMWGQEFGGYRYAPGSLVFYGNFFTLQDTDENKQTRYIKPFIRDLEWEIYYGILEASGFSGFHDDNQFTSDRLVLKYDPKKTPETYREFQLFNSQGRLKTFIEPRENIRKIHEKPKGVPLYFNEGKNFSILGSRGGGKSYTVAGLLLHALITDGGRYYSEETGKFYSRPVYEDKYLMIDKNVPMVELLVGSGDTDKSSEFISKITQAMNALATEKEFGVWGEPGDLEYTPCPLYKDMSGSTEPGNKKNPWMHEYKIIQNGRPVKQGTKSKLLHVSYSEQKAKGRGSQAGAGGRVLYSVVEESGLTSNTIEIHNSNTSVVSRNGIQFGVQIDLGTSGNLDAILQTRKKFTNPQDYNILEYADEWENMGKDGKIGFFLPFYMTLNQYKDKNGNTNFQQCFEHIFEVRSKAARSSDPSVLREEKMNRPIVPSEMWITNKGYYLPYEEAVMREKELLKDNAYQYLGTKVKLVWDPNAPKGVNYTIDPTAEPFYSWPIDSNRLNLDGSVLIYDFPKDNHPNDMYFFTHDPYVSENIESGGSLGVTHGWINPKYWGDYMPVTGPLVCTYISKPMTGLKTYYENQEKLIQLYGNPVGGLAYESNYGSDCKNHYILKNKANLLMIRPSNVDSSSIYAKRVTEYGIVVGNRLSKVKFLDNARFFLLDKILVNGESEYRTLISTIPCIFTIRQIMSYDLDENFDAVSSLILAPKYIEALEFEQTERIKQEHNPLAFLTQNNRIFRDPDPVRTQKEYLEEVEKFSSLNSDL